MTELLSLKKIPFHIGLKDTPTNAPFPDELEFKAAINPSFNLLIQYPNAAVSDLLDKVYQSHGPIGTPMNTDGLGAKYAEDFLSFVLKTLERTDLKGLKVLEIGSGNGYLLSRLLDLGADAIGFEPGTHGFLAARESNLPIINQPFSKDLVEVKFDIILHYAVLEHLEKPLEIITSLQEVLKPDGNMIFSVPNCEPYIETGDISMFIHEHWSYFTRDSLQKIADNEFLIEC